MADYVSREVARERLRKACQGGSAISAIVLLIGLLFGGIAAVIWFDVQLPFDFMYTGLNAIVPTVSDAMLSVAECGTKALLLFLMGFVGLLMFRKVSRTGEAFRSGQLRQLKFIAFLMLLLGFLPTVVGNAIKVALSVRAGGPALAVLSLAVEPMCIIASLFMFVACRVLVAGSLLGTQEEELVAADPVAAAPAPNFSGVPDLSSMPTATADADEFDATIKR